MSTNYRVLVQFDAEKSLFVARAPELEHCTAEGASRAEAIAKLEEEINAQVANVRERGGRLPAALDSDEGATGELSAKVSKTLHRELLWQARQEGVEPGQLIGELIAGGLDARRRSGGGRRPGPQGPAEDRNGNQRDGSGGGGQRRGGPGGGGGRGDRDGRYHNIMEDRASFVEYVRSLEQGGGGRGPGGGGGGGRRGGGGGGRGPGGGGGGRGPGGGSGPAGGSGGAPSGDSSGGQ
jgi:predicted RNase H-like HicB family nuclease